PDPRRLVSVVGPSRARDMLFTGRFLDASAAAQAGLVDFVVPVDEFDARLDDYIAEIRANSQYSVRGIKEIVGLVERGAL
ncbi:enoyl-CoA hydratase-related protein, partial [Acinetobacter baumannii]